MNIQITNDQATDTKWKSLYKAGGVGALIVGTLLLVEMIAYLTTSAPDLTDTAGWFNLFHNNRFIGLNRLWHPGTLCPGPLCTDVSRPLCRLAASQ